MCEIFEFDLLRRQKYFQRIKKLISHPNFNYSMVSKSYAATRSVIEDIQNSEFLISNLEIEVYGNKKRSEAIY